MDLVFICSPYRGDREKNTERVKRYCWHAAIEQKIPIAPHLYFTQFLLDDSCVERHEGMRMGLDLLRRCSEMRIYCTELTEGMIGEIKEARNQNIRMRFFTPEMEELNRDNYIIHPELGPGYRRLIAESFGDCFYFEGCAGGCSNCRRSEGDGNKSGSESERRTGEKEPAEGSGSEDRKHTGSFLGIRFRRKNHI